MSYYPPHTGSSSYPYTYHPSNPYAPAHPQTAGNYAATPYHSAYPGTAGPSGYSAQWTYPYSYYPPSTATSGQAASTPARPAASSVATSAQVATTSATTTAIPAPPQRTASTPTTYTYAAATSVIPRSKGKHATYRGMFSKELRNLMYGFGDDRNPSNDTVNVLEEILVEYIIDVCQTALTPGKKSRLSIEDLRRALSRPADAKKLARMEELLFMQEDIKRARAQFEESDMNQAAPFQG